MCDQLQSPFWFFAVTIKLNILMELGFWGFRVNLYNHRFLFVVFEDFAAVYSGFMFERLTPKPQHPIKIISLGVLWIIMSIYSRANNIVSLFQITPNRCFWDVSRTVFITIIINQRRVMSVSPSGSGITHRIKWSTCAGTYMCYICRIWWSYLLDLADLIAQKP